jgi:glycerophosphoryl diester phosphodiesterase
VVSHPYIGLEHPIRFAHRGSRILWPENTMYAFERVIDDYGYRYLEIDVRITADRRVVVFHDATLDRMTNGSGEVADWRLEDLRHLDVGYSFDEENDFPLRGHGIGIPTLEELFKAWPDVHVNIDLKARGSEWPVAEVIRRCGREDRVLVGSFNDRRIARFRRITKGAVATSAGPTASALMYAASRAGRSISRPVAAYQLPFDYRGLGIDRRLVDAVHAADAHLHVWTVNEPDDMERLLDLEVDGIVTDRPDLLNEVMGVGIG